MSVYLDDKSARPFELAWPATAADGWLHMGRSSERDQGWKLHVSATIGSAATVLEHVLPILKAEDAQFKVAANLGCLGDLNEGLAGLSQVGKFITIYPLDDAQAVRLAVELDRVTAGLEGPRIPSDRPLRPGSLVHYRFGGFTDLMLTDSLGQTVPALRGPSGEFVPDVRTSRFEFPAWAADPFETAGVVEQPPAPPDSLFGGYLILAVLHQHAKGGVFLALDPHPTPPKLVVIKEGRRHVMTDEIGRDVGERLRHQHKLLQTFGPHSSLPQVLELFEREGNVYLVMEYIEGSSLERLVSERQLKGHRVSTDEVAEIGQQIAKAVGRLHERGYVLRDLTPGNVLYTPQKQVVLIDLELCHSLDDASPTFGWGTRGYVSPEQQEGQPPTIAQDVYGLGATLYFLATGCTPALLQEGSQNYRRALQLLNPSSSSRLCNAIAACMDPDSSRRPPDMAAAACLLTTSFCLPCAAATGSSYTKVWQRSQQFLELARGAGDFLLATAEKTTTGLCWASRTPGRDEAVIPTHLPRHASYARYLHTGVAGIGLFLADLASISGERRYLEAAEDAARWLLAPDNATKDLLPGLYFGEAGVAAFLARMSQITGDVSYLKAASSILSPLMPECTDVPDLTHGWAGIGLAHLTLAALSSGGHHLSSAHAFGEALVRSSESVDAGVVWRQPPGPHLGLSGETLTGFAHGVAGIAYFLLELGHATGDATYSQLAENAASWLISKSEPCLADAKGMNWPLGAQGNERWFHWCHGPAGIGFFFLRAWALTGSTIYRDIALAGARTISEVGHRGGTTLCHGLAGNGDFLLEVSRVLQEPRWFSDAVRIADILELYARPYIGGLAWPGDHPDVITPDFMVGCAGVGAFLLRMAEPERLGSPLLLPLSWVAPKE